MERQLNLFLFCNELQNFNDLNRVTTFTKYAQPIECINSFTGVRNMNNRWPHCLKVVGVLQSCKDVLLFEASKHHSSKRKSYCSPCTSPRSNIYNVEHLLKACRPRAQQLLQSSKHKTWTSIHVYRQYNKPIRNRSHTFNFIILKYCFAYHWI